MVLSVFVWTGIAQASHSRSTRAERTLELMLDPSGLLTRLNIDGSATQSVSDSGDARLYFDTDDNKIKVSLNGAAYVDISTGASVALTDIDTYAELNAIVADVTLTHNGLIDTSAELLAIVGDETGTGLLVFNNSPSFVDDYTLATAGIKATGSNGTITWLGLGDGSDEDLKLDLNTTSNTGIFTSNTALATLNFSSIALQESGINILNNDEIDASSELLAIMDDETGTGFLVFYDSPIIYDINLNGAAGVRLSASNGTLTFLGLGAGAGEDLKLDLNTTLNTGIFTSGTSLATLNFSSIALQESGIAVLNNDEIDASSELLAIMDDETGTGLLMFNDSPSFVDDYTLAAAGIKATGANGTITWLGLGTGADEDLKLDLDTTANVAALSSTTGVTQLNLTSIRLGSNAPALKTLTGSIDTTASTTMTGVGTAFLTELAVGERVLVGVEERIINSCSTNTACVVNAAFTDQADDASPEVYKGALLPARGSDHSFSGACLIGYSKVGDWCMDTDGTLATLRPDVTADEMAWATTVVETGARMARIRSRVVVTNDATAASEEVYTCVMPGDTTDVTCGANSEIAADAKGGLASEVSVDVNTFDVQTDTSGQVKTWCDFIGSPASGSCAWYKVGYMP